MRIAVDISPIEKGSKSAHKVRGVGKYITLLRDSLEKYDQKNTYIFTDTPRFTGSDVDLIHYPYFDPYFITLPLINRVPTVVTVHDVIPLVHKKHFPVGIKGMVKWQLNKRRLKNVSAIITNSQASKDDIHQVTGITFKKIFPIPLSVDPEFRKLGDGAWKNEVRHKYGLPENFILYVGDVTWNKNLPRLVEAIIKVNIPLVMVGKAIVETDFDKANPWNADRLIVLRETENESLFIKLGFVPTEDLVKIYNLAQALVMPSLDEGFGLPILEAMKSGCPVITSNLGSIPEVAGDAALYVDAYDVKSIAEGIKKSIEPESPLLLKEKCIHQAEKFTVEQFIKQTVKVYENF